MFSIDPILYLPIYNFTTTCFCLYFAFKWLSKPGYSIIYSKSHGLLDVTLCTIFLGLWLGMRDLNSAWFGDTALYGQLYEYSTAWDFHSFDFSELGWDWLNYIFRSNNFSAQFFFTVIALIYFSSYATAISRIFKSNVWGAFIIFLISFSTYAFCVNGIRNGLATALLILGMSYTVNIKRMHCVVIGIALMALATFIHKTVWLPIICFILAGIVRNFNIYLVCWLITILLSLISGNYFAEIFASMGFDDRMVQYVNLGKEYSKLGYKVGFRWDFLIYSSAPIVLGYYAIVKKNIKDINYELLLNTYTLANTIWLLVIRAAFSNRFAYLSWFLYPIVFAYPLLNFKLWSDQNKKVALILFGYIILNLAV